MRDSFKTAAKDIFKLYIARDCPVPVNISAHAVKHLTSAIKRAPGDIYLKEASELMRNVIDTHFDNFMLETYPESQGVRRTKVTV